MRPRLSYANVVATTALFVALGGTAIATHPGGQNTISSGDLIDAHVRAADIAAGAVATAELANGEVKTADIGTGEVRSGDVADDILTGGDVAANSLKGADIDESTLDVGDTARAYARVNPDNCPGFPLSCEFDQSKGVSSVVREDLGLYCVTVPGIDANEVPAAVTVDSYTTATPKGNASAMTREGATCGADGKSFYVRTEYQDAVVVDAGGGSKVVSGNAHGSNKVGFTIAIP